MNGHPTLPLNRGSHEGADCANCPFSKDGLPNKPVYGEWPDDPLWLIVGEGPGHNEVIKRRPFVGATGECVNGMLAKIGRPRGELAMMNATLCIPFQGASEQDRQRAAAACKPRLLGELRLFPKKPILTLGAVAARSIIPKEALDAIDPPESAKVVRKQHKLKSQPAMKAAINRRKAIDKITKRRLAKMLKHHRKVLIADCKRRGGKPDEKWLEREIARVHAQVQMKARQDAIKEYDVRIKEHELKKLTNLSKPKKPKPKQVKISDICGTLFELDLDGTGPRPLIPAIHPAALLRGGGASIAGSHTPDMAYVNLIYDASKIDSLARGKDIRLNVNVEYEMVESGRAARLFLEVFREALEEGACSLDLETYVDDDQRHSALMAYVAKIRVIGLATNRRAVSLSWDLLPEWCSRSLLQILLSSVVVRYHNALYDRTVLAAYGFVILSLPFDDTLLGHHAAFPGNSHRLQTVVGQFFGIAPWKSEFRNAEETPEKLAIYNAKDTGGTHAVWKPISIHIKRNGVQQVYELDKKMSSMASQMHLSGMPVDRDINHELMRTFSRNVVESRRAVEDIARDPKLRDQIWHHLAINQAGKKRKLDPSDFEERYQIRLSAMKLDPDWKWKIGSGKHIAALLQAMGVGLYQKTEKGELTTKKDVLEGLVDVPIVRDILAYRENDKLYSTFVAPIFDCFDSGGNLISYGYADSNSRIHPVWNVHRISGRWASAWPVVSNVPKDKWKKLIGDMLAIVMGVDLPKDGTVTLPDGTVVRSRSKDKSVSKLVRPNLRQQVRVRPGRKIVGFDFGQIEARVIALISGDEFLCSVFADPSRDIHRECARMVFVGFDGLDKDSQSALRERIKPIEYGFMYLAQVDTLHRQLLKEGTDIRREDLAKAIAKLGQLMGGVLKWQANAVRKASRPPFEVREVILGRRRVWPMGQVEATEACNSDVQPAAAALMNMGMARFMENSMWKYRDLDPLAQIHDAAYFECWEDDAEALAADIQRDFECERVHNGRTVFFPVNVKKGDSWADV